jgi:phosphopantetheine adenylyltransferase
MAKNKEKNFFTIINKDNLELLDNYIETVELNKNIFDNEILNNYLLTMKKLNNTIAQEIELLITKTDNLNELYKNIENKIEINKKKEKEKENIKINNFSDLLNKIINIEQKKRLYKILPDNEDYAKVYLQGYTKNEDMKKKNLLGTIKILGQYNFSKNEREAYEIKVLKNEPATFWCSCIDHKLNSKKKDIVCKHISFIVCKVMKILELYFFDTKKLSEEHLQLLLEKFSDKSEFWKNKDFVRNIKVINLDSFKNFPLKIDGVCTFCYDDMTDDDKPKSLCCPLCKHCFHSECMDIWLENYSKCTVCSSDFWKHYKKVKDGKNINIDDNNKL